MFSVIILFNELRKEIITKKFFSRLSSSLRNQQKIEVIFVVENDYELINHIQDFQNANPNCIVKFIFSNRENSLNKILEQVNKIVTNDYFVQLSEANDVYISEYEAPDDFECVLEIPTKTIIRDGSDKVSYRTEKLFKYNY